MTTEFFILAAIAGFCYALQGTLLSKYARQFDGFTSSLFRNASFIVTMVPLLFLAGIDGIVSLQYSWLYLLCSGIFGMIALSLGFSAHKYLPVAIANSIGQLSPLLLFLWTFVLINGQVPSLQEFIFVGIVLFGLIILNFSNYNFDHLEKNTSRGFLFAFLGIAFGSVGIVMMVKASEISDPFAVTYAWEALIGLFFLLTYFLKTKYKLSEKENIPELIRVFVGKKDAKLPTKKEALQIALAASPTIIASTILVSIMGAALDPEVNISPGTISTIVSAVGAITGMTLAWFLYKEKLSLHHFIGIFCIVVGIGLMRVFG